MNTAPARDERHNRLAQAYLQALLKADRHGAVDLIMDAVGDWAVVKDIYLHVLQPVQYEIGRLWQRNTISVAQEHYSTAVTQMVISQLFPLILNPHKGPYSMLGCCVGGELHELGMRMVSDFFEMDSWTTYYIGASTPDSDVLRTAVEHGVDLVCVSVTMTYNVHLAARLISRLRQTPELDECKILVGGYPFLIDRELWKTVGADGTGENAADAVRVAERLIAEEAPHGT